MILSRWWSGALLAGLFLGWTASLPAQVRPGQAKKIGDQVEAKQFKQVQGQFDSYVRGSQPPAGDAKRVLELAARYYVYRLTWFEETARLYRKQFIEETQTDFKRQIKNAVDNLDKNQETLRLWTPMLISCFTEIFDQPFDSNRVACVNAALLLPDLADLKRREIGDFLLKLVQDPKKHESIKRYAAEGLSRFLPATEFTVSVAPTKANLMKRAEDQKRVEALINLVTQPFDPAKMDKAAYHYLRRMAIAALGSARVPAMEVDIKTKKIDANVVGVLLPLLSDPEATLPEKIEAAIALCNIRVDPNSQYQPDETIYRVGVFLVELGGAYKVDYSKFGGRGAKGSVPILPWRYHGQRLQLALTELVNSIKGDETRQKAVDSALKLQRSAAPLLKVMQATPQGAFTTANDLADNVNTLRPATKQIFKGIPATASE